MSEQIEFTEEDIHDTLISFSKDVLMKLETDFTISKIININKDGIDKYSFEISISNNRVLKKIPKRAVLKVNDGIKIIDTNESIKVSLRYPDELKKQRIGGPCSNEITYTHNLITGGIGLSDTRTAMARLTLGCLIECDTKNKETIKYGLTCFHGTSINQKFYSRKNGKSQLVGKINKETPRNDEIDYSLILINKNSLKIKSGTLFGKSLEFSRNYPYQKKVRKYGYKTKHTNGEIISDFACIYNNSTNKLCKGLIEVKGNNNCIFSDNSDSGSLVIDTNNYPVGLLKGKCHSSFNNNSFLVPICSITKDILNNSKHNIININFNF